MSNDKARSEVIITPILLEVQEYLDNRISVFSGDGCNVELEVGLNSTCNFLVSQSTEQISSD